MLVLKYGDGRREAFLTVRTANGRCVTVKDMAALFGQAAGAEFVPSRNGKTLVTRKTSTVRLIEKGNYRLLFGAARTPKEGEEVSGDNYMFRNTLPGQVALSLSDGMGADRRRERTAGGSWSSRNSFSTRDSPRDRR